MQGCCLKQIDEATWGGPNPPTTTGGPLRHQRGREGRVLPVAQGQTCPSQHPGMPPRPRMHLQSESCNTHRTCQPPQFHFSVQQPHRINDGFGRAARRMPGALCGVELSSPSQVHNAAMTSFCVPVRDCAKTMQRQPRTTSHDANSCVCEQSCEPAGKMRTVMLTVLKSGLCQSHGTVERDAMTIGNRGNRGRTMDEAPKDTHNPNNSSYGWGGSVVRGTAIVQLRARLALLSQSWQDSPCSIKVQKHFHLELNLW